MATATQTTFDLYWHPLWEPCNWHGLAKPGRIHPAETGTGTFRGKSAEGLCRTLARLKQRDPASITKGQPIRLEERDLARLAGIQAAMPTLFPGTEALRQALCDHCVILVWFRERTELEFELSPTHLPERFASFADMKPECQPTTWESAMQAVVNGACDYDEVHAIVTACANAADGGSDDPAPWSSPWGFDIDSKVDEVMASQDPDCEAAREIVACGKAADEWLATQN